MNRSFGERLPVFLGGLLMLGAVLASCGGGQSGGGQQGGEGETEEPIKIGVINALSGPAAQSGQAAQRGIEVGVEMVNDAGGIDGRPIELIVEDDEGKPEVAARLVGELASDSEVALILGPYQATSVAAADTQARKEEIPLIAFTGASYVPPDGEDRTWITVPNITFDVTGATFTEYAVEQGWTNVATLNPTDLTGQLADKVLDNLIEEYDIEGVVRERYDPAALDVTPQLGEVEAANADVLYSYAGSEPASLVIRQAQQVGLEIPINVSHINLTPAFLELVKDVPNDTVYVAGTKIYDWENLPADDPQKELFEEFTTMFGERFPDMEAGYIESLGGDLILISADALRNAGTEREAIREYLSQGNQDITGMVTPSYNFTEEDRLGFTAEGLIVLTNRDGKWVAVES